VPAEWVLVAYLCLGFPEAETNTPALETAGWEHRRDRTLLRR
jgi:5,6-dimethylbenzimidazole synthase